VHAHECVSDHDPCDAVSPDPVTAVTQLPENPWCPVGVAREGVDGLDLIEEHVVVPLSLTGLVVQPRVVGRAGQIDHATQIADGVLGLVVVEEAHVRSPQRLFREIGGGLSQDLHVLTLLGVLPAQPLQLRRVVRFERRRILST